MYFNRIAVITVIAFFVLSLGGLLQAAEELEITTYYPAPYGVYKKLNLYPTDDFDPTIACSATGANRGDMFYDDSDDMSYICDSTDTWQTLESPWTLDTSGGFPAVSIADPNARIGIGVANPTESLDVNGNIATSGTVNAPAVCLAGDCRGAWPADTNTMLQMPDGTKSIGGVTYELDRYGYDPASGESGWVYVDPATGNTDVEAPTYGP